MIGRRKSRRGEPRHGRSAEQQYDELLEDDQYDSFDEEEAPERATSGDGPYDIEQVADPGAHNRIDLGGLWLPTVPGLDLRLNVEEQSGSVLSAVCVLGNSAVELRAFAAPRSGGLWQEVRADMAHQIREQGDEASEADGPFGPEVRAIMSVPGPQGGLERQEIRFAGIERPRWMLQAIFTGEAVHDPFAAAPLENLVRDVVVVRGPEPMARGEQLEMRLPPQAVPGQHAADDEYDPADDGRAPLRPFERGPEITEIH